jgi:PAS domain S-box-containing protein
MCNLFDGGDMGAAIRAHDWRASPVGMPDAWPDALANALNLMLNSPESMYLVWGEALTFFFNDAYRPILGPRLDGALGRPLPVLWSDAWPAVGPNIERALAGQASRFVDVPIEMNRRGEPETTWWSYSYSPIYEGDRVAGVFCYTTETTERVLAQRALTSEAARLRGILDDMPGFIWTADRDGVLGYVSANFARMSGLDEGQFLGRAWRELIHPDDIERMDERWALALRTLTPFETEYRLRLADGSYRWLLGRAVPTGGSGVGDIGTRDTAWVGTGIDMGTIVAARDTLVRSQRDLQLSLGEQARRLLDAESALQQSQKMELVGQLTSGLAHDFNNQLGAIRSAVDLLGLKIDACCKSALGREIEIVKNAVGRAGALTQRLLAMSRKQELAPDLVEPAQVVASIADFAGRTFGHAFRVTSGAAPDAWPVCVDHSRLENALLNLCINARDAMPAGGAIVLEAANAHVDAREAAALDVAAGDYVRLTVRDDGAGMAPDVLEKAFEPFFTTKPAGLGTGLGLPMVYGFARQVGGQVHIASVQGAGTTVSLFIPRHRRDESAGS